MTGLMYSGVFRADLKKPDYPNNDRLIFSKGHAAPLLYALYAVAGALPTAQLTTLRKFGSPLEGHPMPEFRYTEAPTGSLGQGVSVALGEALGAKLGRLSYHVYCLLGDSEMAEGSVWEAIQLAGFRRVGNLIGIIDFNRLGQSGATMYGRNARGLAKRIQAFGWEVLVIDGHDITQVQAAYRRAQQSKSRPTMIIGQTVKGKGVALMENKNGWHGKALTKEQAAQALDELGPVDLRLRGTVATPSRQRMHLPAKNPAGKMHYRRGQSIAPRAALGRGLARLAPAVPELVVLDGEVKNSTDTEIFAKKFPSRFIEGYIAEQNLVGMCGGLAKRGWRPVFATFAAFLTRAYDQLRMQSYAGTDQVYIGTHAGVEIGQDGVSQMGLQDLAMFRTLEDTTILYPSDAVASEKLLEQALRAKGTVYLRTTRGALPVLYPNSTAFPVGGSHVLRKSPRDRCTIVTAGATLHEALQAADELAEQKIAVRVIDLYSIKPIDTQTLTRAVRDTGQLLVVEDHYPEGGIAEAVRSALGKNAGSVVSLAVIKTPTSGSPNQLYAYENLDARSIARRVQRLIRS